MQGPASIEVRARFRMLGPQVSTAGAWRYDFALEPSPTSADLHAVLITAESAFAFGDRGTILVRTGAGPWMLAPSPTQERLRGASNFGIVVGDHGTWLSEQRGQWSAQSSGTDEDLYAVTRFGSHDFAVGDHGVMIERSPDGRFSRVETRTMARLRGIWHSHDGLAANHGELMDDLYLVGDGGTIVDCALRMDPPVCIPRPSPTGENLLQVIDAIPAAATFKDAHAALLKALILGSEGTVLGAALGSDPPYDFVQVPLGLPPGMERIVAHRAHHGTGKIFVAGVPIFPPLVAVGAGGRGALFDGRELVPFALPGVGDLHDLVVDEIDVFAVGGAGGIVHGALHDAMEISPVMMME